MSDGEYFSRRAQEEREAAIKTAHPGARQTHLELAEAYERSARAAKQQAPLRHSSRCSVESLGEAGRPPQGRPDAT